MRRLDRRDPAGDRGVAVLRGGADVRGRSGGARVATNIRPVQVLPPRPRGERRQVSLPRVVIVFRFHFWSAVALRIRYMAQKRGGIYLHIYVMADFGGNFSYDDIRFYFGMLGVCVRVPYTVMSMIR